MEGTVAEDVITRLDDGGVRLVAVAMDGVLRHEPVSHMCLRYEVYCIRIIKLIQEEHIYNIIEDERKKYQKNR